jgi:hypothetical protein
MADPPNPISPEGGWPFHHPWWWSYLHPASGPWWRQHEQLYPPNPCAPAVFILVEAAKAKQVAASLPEGPARTQLERRADQAIDALLDDVCGTRPPWPWPGPPPWVVDIASQLAELANLAQANAVREELIRIAGRALEKGTSAASAS